MRQLDEVRRLRRAGHEGRPDIDDRLVLVAALATVLCVVSVGKFDLQRVLGFFAVPLFLVPALGVPLKPLARKLLFVSPFVLLLGIFNPLLDTRPLPAAFPVAMSAGMASFLVITAKALLSVLVVAVLMEWMPFEAIAAGLRGLRVPEVFVVQLAFLHRYLFVLVEEAQSMRRARDLKSCGRRGLGPRVTARLLGSLFLRTLDRSQRIYRCMVARGFDGTIRTPPRRPWAARDGALLLAVGAVLAGLRLGLP